jgi:hypothetical protein
MACGSSEKKGDKAKIEEEEPEDIALTYKGPDFEMINNCLRTTLSYKLQIEPRDYDSIATYYFHEIRDYADKAIRTKNRTLKLLQANLRDSLTILKEDRAKSLEGQIDIMQQDINSHTKEVIGFVFVHTFRIKEKDTMSAIYVMDQNCGFKELIKVKAISDPNPEDYIESIRSIER